MSNPLDRWPVEVCGKCGGRTCKECSPAPSLEALRKAIDRQQELIQEMVVVMDQLANKLKEVADYAKSHTH